MRLSRKPKNLVIVMLMAVMLMTMAGLAAAAPAVNWGFTDGQYISSVTGTVSDDTYQHVYATVYANVYGTLVPTSIVNQDIYSAQTFAVSLAGRGLTAGQTYPVALVVYSSNTTPVNLATATITPIAPRNFKYNVASTDTTSSGGGGGSTTTTTTTTTTPAATTLPAISATIGTPVSVTASTGGTISATGITIAIPAGALTGNAKVTVAKVADVTGLTVPAAAKLVSDVLEITKDLAGDFSKPITLTLNFDKTKVDATKFDVKVCFFDEKAKTWVPLSNTKVEDGKVSGDVTHFTKFAVLTFPKEAAKPAATLSDITGHWAAANIQKLVDLKAIAGYPDGTFKPNNTITRAEFATVLVKALNLAPSSSKVFADTANHWAKDSISAAAAAGIVNGYSATQFGPNDPITREQMAVMITKAAKLAKAEGKTFSDGAAIAAWAKDAVASATAASVMSGYPDNSFKPQGNATRAEAVTVIVKTMK